MTCLDSGEWIVTLKEFGNKIISFCFLNPFKVVLFLLHVPASLYQAVMLVSDIQMMNDDQTS